MAAEQQRERDLVLAPGQQVLVLDESKGVVNDYVGPYKTSPSDSEKPVVFNPLTGTFDRCSNLNQAITNWPRADEGSYIILENPALTGEGGGPEHPSPGSHSMVKLANGRKINIPGPATFPLWPGQVATVVPGHRLRSNQYLVVRVYNEEEARRNWAKAVMKPKSGQAEGGGEKAAAEDAKPRSMDPGAQPVPELTTGQLLVIRGKDVAFYIPPTGIEVLKDSKGVYVREAVTLERLEYCILLDEDGNKRFVRGPEVVFPKPTETFVTAGDSRKFRAIELNPNMGLYVKVIADYSDDSGQQHSAGEELFITGKDTKIYYPRPEHAIVRYGDEHMHFAVAIPGGEARYVLDNTMGSVNLMKGACMFLPDPRKEVIVRRALDPKTVALWFPGNKEALEYNMSLMQLRAGKRPEEFVTERKAKGLHGEPATADMMEMVTTEEFERRSKFTPPRTITLDTKYDGAVSISVWTGYAVQVVGKTGERRVVSGPETVILEYDETLEVLELSTGTPKSDDALIRTVYLRVSNNKVSDIVTAETRDLVQVNIRLSYRVNFEGNPEKWFGVENYVKFLIEHLRSLIRNAIRSHGIEGFMADSTAIIRDSVLGVAAEGGKRPGRVFEENGMRVYDVDVLDVSIGNREIAALLIAAQHRSVQEAIKVAQGERDLEVTRRLEAIAQQNLAAKAETEGKRLELEKGTLSQMLGVELARLGNEVRVEQERLAASLAETEKRGEIQGLELRMDWAKAEQAIAIDTKTEELRLQGLKAEVDAVVARANAFGPDVVAALQAFADKELAGRVAQSMAPLSIIGGKSVMEIVKGMLEGTYLEKVLGKKEA